MTNTKSSLKSLRRPKLLVRAARMGLRFYQRDRDLARVLRTDLTSKRALSALLEAEQVIEANRKKRDNTYSIQAHISVLTALIAEAHMPSGPAPT